MTNDLFTFPSPTRRRDDPRQGEVILRTPEEIDVSPDGPSKQPS
jgi:hypothetical protein